MTDDITEKDATTKEQNRKRLLRCLDALNDAFKELSLEWDTNPIAEEALTDLEHYPFETSFDNEYLKVIEFVQEAREKVEASA